METRRRALLKAVTWRIIASTVTGLLAYCALDSRLAALTGATAVAVGDTVVKFVLYFLHERVWNRTSYGRADGFVVWFYGLPASGKTTLAKALSAYLRDRGFRVTRLDGDVLRDKDGGLCSDLGFSAQDRHENLRRTMEAAKLLTEAGSIAVVANIMPREENRSMVRGRLPKLLLVYVKASSKVCEQRDDPETGTRKSGMWQKALKGEILQYTGVSDPFEPPPVGCCPDMMTVDTVLFDGEIDHCVEAVVQQLRQRRWV